jgi:CelD/BcsL family acetyltransferase involved in cellulose biosynthesis
VDAVSARVGIGGRQVSVLHCRDVLSRIGPELDELLVASSAPITARRPWLDTWIRCYPDHDPFAILLRDQGGRLEGAALLARRRVRGILRIVALGHGPSDYARLPARDPASAAEVGRALASHLRSLRDPWTLRLDQLPADDPAAEAIASSLRWARLGPGDPSPVLRFGSERTLKPYLSRNSNQTLRTAHNRIRKAGLEEEVRCAAGSEAVGLVLPEVEAVRRERDGALRRRSDLDHEQAGPFWREVILHLAERGEAEVVVVRLAGEVAGYVVGLLDGASYRMWDGRLSPRWAQFSPGRLADYAAISRALEDPRFIEYDHMRGTERYKLATTTDLVPAWHLRAWSSPVVLGLTEGPRRTRSALKAIKDRSPLLKRGWDSVKARTVARGPAPERREPAR